MRISKVTTKAGDTGLTLLGCDMVRKEHPRIELLGELDEFNCRLGDCETLQFLQNIVFEISAAVYKNQDFPHLHDHTKYLEDRIQDLNDTLPALKEFILPAGPFHLARSTCRKVERMMWKEYRSLPEAEETLIFLNRLSDYLFVLARVDSPKDVQWSREKLVDNIS